MYVTSDEILTNRRWLKSGAVRTLSRAGGTVLTIKSLLKIVRLYSVERASAIMNKNEKRLARNIQQLTTFNNQLMNKTAATSASLTTTNQHPKQAMKKLDL